jgi:RluA family pseudouridine synthase
MADDPFLPPGSVVLHDDEHLLVVDKPAGVLSHPNSRGPRGKVAFLGSYDAKARVFRKAGQELFLVHRLDRETSGVLMAARDAATREALEEAFREGRVEKRYLALLSRVPSRDQGRWADHLVTPRGGGKVSSRVIPGKPPNAFAGYRLLRRVGPYALVEVALETGRTHQIRVQAAHRRLSVLGDRVYGDYEANKRARKDLGLKRMYLHAASLGLSHPATGEALHLEAPLPADLEAASRGGHRRGAGAPSSGSGRPRSKATGSPARKPSRKPARTPKRPKRGPRGRAPKR